MLVRTRKTKKRKFKKTKKKPNLEDRRRKKRRPKSELNGNSRSFPNTLLTLEELKLSTLSSKKSFWRLLK
jgi:hypothetical protein